MSKIQNPDSFFFLFFLPLFLSSSLPLFLSSSLPLQAFVSISIHMPPVSAATPVSVVPPIYICSARVQILHLFQPFSIFIPFSFALHHHPHHHHHPRTVALDEISVQTGGWPVRVIADQRFVRNYL